MARRARDPDGQFKADDPATPENEAWESGKSPRRTSRKPASIEPRERRTAVPAVIETPEGVVKIHANAPCITPDDMRQSCGAVLSADVSDDLIEQALEIAHQSLEAYVGGTIPRKPAKPEQDAIIRCALYAIQMNWVRPGRILREREMPAASRAPFTYRLVGRRRPQIYNPQNIGGPIRGVQRLTR